MKLMYLKLRKELKNFFSEYPEVKWGMHVSVISEGFPGTFYLSFNEAELLETYGNYIDFPVPLFYGKIQPVIRHNDFLEKILPNKNVYKYLGLFDMGGISLSDPKIKNLKATTEKMIEYGFKFLIEKLSLNPKKLFIKLSKGGEVTDITKSKYRFDKKILQDDLSLEKWLKLGIKKENIIFDSTRDTFLALHLYGRPSPWGYRNEIFYDIGKGIDEENLLDIGTVEYMPWRPVIINEEISDIIENKCFSSLIVFGLERLLMARNRYKHIAECDHILPLYNEIISNSKTKEQNHKAFILTEAIRVAHRIFSDCQGYANLKNRHRKKRLTNYLQVTFKMSNELEIEQEKIKEFLALNAELNPFYPELKKNIELTNKEILDSFERKSQQK